MGHQEGCQAERIGHGRAYAMVVNLSRKRNMNRLDIFSILHCFFGDITLLQTFSKINAGLKMSSNGATKTIL